MLDGRGVSCGGFLRGELLVVEDAEGAALDADIVTGVNESFGSCGGDYGDGIEIMAAALGRGETYAQSGARAA